MFALRRREFITFLGGAAAAWPLAARAQPPLLPVIGYLSSISRETATLSVSALRQGLRETGYVENRNVAIDFRWARGHYDLLPALAAELVGRPVAVIVAAGLPSAVAAKAATATIPIVFIMGADPVAQGIVASLNRPGENITGVTQFFGALGGKRLELIRDLLPSATMIGVLSNPTNPNATNHLRDVEAAAQVFGQKTQIVTASTETEIDAAFAHAAHERFDALLVADDPLYSVRRDQLVALAAQHALPTIYYQRDFCAAGGLASYGSDISDNHRQVGVYIGRILNGTKPIDLPVLQPTKFELVINLTTAKALGLKVPPTLLARADEVIE